MPLTLEEQIGNWCKHFNGIHNKKCRIGISYDQMGGRGGLPCLKNNACAEKCSSAVFPTEQEVAEEAIRQKAQIKEALTRLQNGFCPHCGEQIKKENQVGRCVYAEPCGHRLFQGKAKEPNQD